MVHALGDLSDSVTVLGGLIPALLTGGQTPSAPTHLGTTDVDVMLGVHLATAPAGYASVEDRIRRIGFEPATAAGWHWLAPVDGHKLKVEFLCDLVDQPEGEVYRPPDCAVFGAINLRGTGYVARDVVVRRLDAALTDRPGTAAVDVRTAGLAGYLASKAFAILGRGFAKDYYDFAYVLLYNTQGGPVEAAEAMNRAEFGPEIRAHPTLLREVGDRYGDTRRVGPQSYAREAFTANPEREDSRLREDAVSAVSDFLSALGRD